MNNSTSTPATLHLAPRHLVGLIVALAAATSVLTSALTATAVDTERQQLHSRVPAPSRTVGVPWSGVTGSNWTSSAGRGSPQDPADNATASSAAAPLVASNAQPIIVADAYHGVGYVVCHDGEQPTTVADAYHGVGVIVCE